MATGQVIVGDVRFARGMDSVSDATTLPEESYVISTNMFHRGGALQTRPGFRALFSLPDGNLQGLSVYKPNVGAPSLVAFVNGIAHSSEFPFNTRRTIAGPALNADSPRVYTVGATKAVTRNTDGSLTLQTPQSLLMAQDGVNPCVYFDGQKMAKADGVPQGTHMAWSGYRLWVARRRQLFAGDFADPLSFVENTYNTLGGSGYFLLPDNITGMAPLPSSSAVKTPLLVYTDSSTEMFRSNVLARDTWPSVEDFQSTLFPTIGCVASRSIVSRAGMMWWLADFGIVKLDSASNSYVTSKTDFIDREMNRAGQSVSEDLSGVASAGYENFLLHSFPNAGIRNNQTWVFDGSPNDVASGEFPSGWSSVWTGINPVEWASVKIGGQTRLFCASADDDGHNRVYEVFTTEKRDNGCDIPWSFETRSYTGGSLQRKEFRYAEYNLSEVSGQVDMRISWSGGNRGLWKAISSPTFFAAEGNVDAARVYLGSDVLYALKRQSRSKRTDDVRNLPQEVLSSAGIEGPVFRVETENESIDVSHALRFEGSGQAAVRSVRLFLDAVPESDSGQPNSEEAEEHFVRFDGAAAKSEEPLRAPPVVFTATKTESARSVWGGYSASATIVSSISQSDADKRASQVARARAEHLLNLSTPELPQ